MGLRTLLVLALGSALSSGCTVTSVGAKGDPPRIESSGLLEGHAAVGLRADERIFRLRVLDGESEGALGELVLWKLFRLEVGALGLAVGIGPFDLALGTLFYEPEVPEMLGEKRAQEASSRGAEEDCEICRQARAGGGSR